MASYQSHEKIDEDAVLYHDQHHYSHSQKPKYINNHQYQQYHDNLKEESPEEPGCPDTQIIQKQSKEIKVNIVL